MLPFKKCPTCGGAVVKKEVEKIVKGGNDTAVLKVIAEVCEKCGERLYTPAQVKRFEAFRKMLFQKKPVGLKAVGRSYVAA